MSKTRKEMVTTVYAEMTSQPDFDTIYEKQSTRGPFYVNLSEAKELMFKYQPFNKFQILQYNIPENEQAKVTKAFNDTQGIVDGTTFSFSTTGDVSAKQIINFKNYVGYWDCWYNPETQKIDSIFVDCNNDEKQSYLYKREADKLQYKISKKDNEINNQKYLFGVAGVIGLIAFLIRDKAPCLSWPIMLGSGFVIAKTLFKGGELKTDRNNFKEQLHHYSIFAKEKEQQQINTIGFMAAIEDKSFKLY